MEFSCRGCGWGNLRIYLLIYQKIEASRGVKVLFTPTTPTHTYVLDDNCYSDIYTKPSLLVVEVSTLMAAI